MKLLTKDVLFNLADGSRVWHKAFRSRVRSVIVIRGSTTHLAAQLLPLGLKNLIFLSVTENFIQVEILNQRHSFSTFVHDVARLFLLQSILLDLRLCKLALVLGPITILERLFFLIDLLAPNLNRFILIFNMLSVKKSLYDSSRVQHTTQLFQVLWLPESVDPQNQRLCPLLSLGEGTLHLGLAVPLLEVVLAESAHLANVILVLQGLQILSYLV